MHYQLHDEQFVALDDNQKQVAMIGFKPINSGKTLVVETTYVDPKLRGQQVAQKLTEAFFNQVLKNHQTIMPLCPYTQAYLRRNPAAQKVLYKASNHIKRSATDEE